jgi:hypothetical protein
LSSAGRSVEVEQDRPERGRQREADDRDASGEQKRGHA